MRCTLLNIPVVKFLKLIQILKFSKSIVNEY